MDSRDDIEIVMCFDSNRKFIDFIKLWTLKGLVRKNCSTIRDVAQLVGNIDEVTIIKRILISTGVNDLDQHQPKEVADEFIQVVNSPRSKFPQIIIIISEITPRKDNLDKAVIECNKLSNNIVDNHEHTFQI